MPFPVSEGDIEAAERELGVRLPVVLRQRLAEDNGGEVVVGDDVFELFKVLDTSDRKRLARTSARNIVRESTAAREWPGFPPQAVNIADNGGGDYLVLLPDGDFLSDQAYVWEHETRRLLPAGPLRPLF